MRFVPEAGLVRVSWDSLFGNLFRGCPSPFGRGWREAPGEGRKCTLIRPFIKASPFRARASPHLLPEGEGLKNQQPLTVRLSKQIFQRELHDPRIQCRKNLAELS